MKSMTLAASGLLISFAVTAAPAPWYLWKSKLDGNVWCTQTPPGEGWMQLGGPYRDAHCKILGRPAK